MESLAEISIRRTLRKYKWLIELARKHRIQIVLLQRITDFLDKIGYLRKEGEHLNLGLILKNKPLRLERPFIERKRFHLSDISKFTHFKSIVNGSTLCYIIDEKGMITVGKVPSNVLKETSSLTLKNLSEIYQTIAFCVRASTVEIYDSGELVRTWRGGSWIKPCSMPLEKLEREGFPLDLLELTLELCMKLSETRKGGTFVICKNDHPKNYSPMIRDYTFRKSRADHVSLNQMLKFSSLDGAVIMNTKKEIIDIGQRLELPPSTKYSRESGRGARHNSAAMYSAAVDSVVFVVSEDGPVSLYFEGDLYARCFEELFGSK